MKKILITVVITTSVTAGIIYMMHRLKNKNSSDIILDFAEYALGGG